MEQRKFKFLLKDQAFTILPFKNLMDVPLNIYNSLIFDQDHQYQVQSDVSIEVFKSFIQFLIYGTIPEIRIDNITEYSQLSDEFQLLKELISQKKLEFGEYLINLNGLFYQKNKDLSKFEEEISSKLDDYLTKHGKELMKSPIQSLYNIFYNEKRNLTQHDLAYQLITDHYKQTNDSNIFILLDSLDGTKLERAYVDESFQLFESRNKHMPKIDLAFISKNLEKQQKFEEKLIEIEKKFESQNRLLNEKLNEMEIEKNRIEKNSADEINKLKEIIEKLKNDHKNDDEINELKETVEKIKNDHKNDDEINKLKESIGNLSKTVDENKLNHQKNHDEIDLVKKNISRLETNLTEINKSIKNANTQIDELNRRILSIETKIKDIEHQLDCINAITETKIFKYDGNQKFNGIMKYLSDTTKGNILENGTVSITSNSINSDHPLRNLVDFGNTNCCYYRSENNERSIICFDFKDKLIQITNYSIQTGTYTENAGHLKSWSIEVSKDKNEWTEIDHRENDSSLNGCDFISSFNVQHQTNNFYQYVRLRQTGDTWYNDYKNLFEITLIEFFGKLKL